MAYKPSDDNLIEQLVSGLRPVRVLWPPVIRMVFWLVIVLAYFGFAGSVFDVRSDLAIKLDDMSFTLELFLAFSLGVFGALASAFLCVPDMQGQRWPVALVLSVFVVFIAGMLFQIVSEGMSFPHSAWHHCFGDSIILGGVPAFLLVMMANRGATTHPYGMAVMNALAAGGLGWGMMRIVCEADAFGHIFFYHFLPFVLIGTVLALFARRFYRW